MTDMQSTIELVIRPLTSESFGDGESYSDDELAQLNDLWSNFLYECSPIDCDVTLRNPSNGKPWMLKDASEDHVEQFTTWYTYQAWDQFIATL